MKLEKLVHTALDELRMQMLGAQVFFGLQLNLVFQEGFTSASRAVRISDMVALSLIVLTLGLLLAPPSQHRLIEGGRATLRILNVSQRFAELALLPLGLSMGCAVYVACERWLGTSLSLVLALATTGVTLAFWYCYGAILRNTQNREKKAMGPPATGNTELHEKIDQMLTEARVILPGAQALMGFQFVVTMSKAFGELPEEIRTVHFIALLLIAFAITLLIAPAAVHRLAFGGLDIERVHSIGSQLVTMALVPLALGIGADLFVASFKVLGSEWTAAVVSALGAMLLLGLWYGLPMIIRRAADP